MLGQLHQALLAEERPRVVAGLADAVGVEQQPVTGFQLLVQHAL